LVIVLFVRNAGLTGMRVVFLARRSGTIATMRS
jgi:hypothetical protein